MNEQTKSISEHHSSGAGDQFPPDKLSTCPFDHSLPLEQIDSCKWISVKHTVFKLNTSPKRRPKHSVLELRTLHRHTEAIASTKRRKTRPEKPYPSQTGRVHGEMQYKEWSPALPDFTQAPKFLKKKKKSIKIIGPWLFWEKFRREGNLP